MKKMHRLIFCFMFMSLFMLKCVDSDGSMDVSLTLPPPTLTSGAISGTAKFTTDIGVATSADVKLVARSNGQIISDICNLGTTPDTDVSFLLIINFSMASAGIGDIITLSMWVDLNGNDEIDSSESLTSTVPVAGCPVFQSAFFCALVYTTTWEIMTSTSTSVPFSYAVTTGATIESGAPVDL